MTPIPSELRELLERIVVAVDELDFSDIRQEARQFLDIQAATPPADAADMGGQAGEEVEVMAYAVDHPEAGYKVYKQFSQWMNGGEWRCDSLMTVAQHQRIVAALSAQQSAHVSVPRELLQDLRDLASDAVDHHRQAFAGYKLERQANMDHVIANADALLNGGET